MARHRGVQAGSHGRRAPTSAQQWLCPQAQPRTFATKEHVNTEGLRWNNVDVSATSVSMHHPGSITSAICCRRVWRAKTTDVVTMEAGAGELIVEQKMLDVETGKCRLEDFALKRKFASLSSKLDRVHRQVKMRLHQKKFTWVPSPCLSDNEAQQLIAQHQARIRDFVHRSCNKLLQDTLLPRFQEVFGSPVDVQRFPQYPSVVKSPMDFGTMKVKLLDEKYSDLQEFVDDAMLVLDNARAFNPPGTDVHVMANCLEDDLVKALKETVIKSREMVDCATLKDIEQKRCELVARAIAQVQKHIDSDIEVAKGVLMDVQREAADTSRWASDVCSWRSDTNPHTSSELFNQVLQLPESLQKLKQGPLRISDFKNASFLFHHSVVSVLAQVSRDSQDYQTTAAVHVPSEAQPVSPEEPASQAAAAAPALAPQQTSDAPGQAATANPLAAGVKGHANNNVTDHVFPGTCQRMLPAASISGSGRRLARINTRGSSASGVATPAVLHDCGTSAFDKHTPRETNRGRYQPHESWVPCRDLARAGGLAWPGLPDGSGCREPHIDVEGIRLKSARAYTCARAISDRTCTTYTAANSSTEWLPLVNSANPDLLESVLTNSPCPLLGAGPSFLLAGHQDGKLHPHRHTQQCSTQGRPGLSGDGGTCPPTPAADKSTKGVKVKPHAVEGKETRARAQEKLRSSTDAPPAVTGSPAQATPHNQRLESLSQVAIRVFSLPNTDADVIHVSRRASHLARCTGVSEVPFQTTQDALLAPSRHKACPLLADMFSPVPSAESWVQRQCYSIRSEAPRVAAVPPQMLDPEAEYDSPDEAAMDSMPADVSHPAASIPMMTPVVAPQSDR